MLPEISLLILVWCLVVPRDLQVERSSQGLAEFVIKIYDSTPTNIAKPIETMVVNIWYKDSVAIEENSMMRFKSDSRNGTRRWIEILNYRFNDLRDSVIYVYRNFSDTARLISKYAFDDTSIKKVGGWGFNQIRKMNYAGDPQPLSDTTIEEINYKRLRVYTERDNVRYKATEYFRCDKRNSIFTFDPYLSKKVGCPCVKFINQMPDDSHGALVTEVNFLRDSLTTEELRVFNSWEQYAKENPLRK